MVQMWILKVLRIIVDQQEEENHLPLIDIRCGLISPVDCRLFAEAYKMG